MSHGRCAVRAVEVKEAPEARRERICRCGTEDRTSRRGDRRVRADAAVVCITDPRWTLHPAMHGSGNGAAFTFTDGFDRV